MKFKDLPIDAMFTFAPRKNAFPSEEMENNSTFYIKIDKRGYMKAYLPRLCPPLYYKVGSINVNVITR